MAVHRIGFTNVSDLHQSCPDHPHGHLAAKCNVIFVHGLKGHPRKTWGPPKKDARHLVSAQPSPSKWKAVQSLFQSKRATSSSISETASERGGNDSSTASSVLSSTSTASSAFSSVFSSVSVSTSASTSTSTSTTEKLFWPLEFLVEDVPQARIWTYGYNADVLAGMFQMNNKNSVSQHGRDLAARLEREVDNDDPIIFVTHSLGGIIVKDALHRSEICRQRTKNIIFFGTPHRGSASAGWGDIASNLARLAGQDPNSKSLKALEVNSEVLENIHEEFKNIVHNQGIKIHTFQEARGMPIMRGIDHKVVDDISSKADLPRSIEIVESIDADHMQMVKCGSKDDHSYRAVYGVIKHFMLGLPEKQPGLDQALASSARLINTSLPLSTAPPVVLPTTVQEKPATASTSTSSHVPALVEPENCNNGPPNRPSVEGSSQIPHRPSVAENGPTGSKPKFIVPYHKNPDFIERSKPMMRIQEQFGHGSFSSAQGRPRVALYGLGGVGKTQIALSYVYWLQQHYPEMSIFWVHASSADRFRHAYSNIARECDIPDHDDSNADLLELVKDYLESSASSPWMLVIDNADDADLFFQQSMSNQPSAPGNIASNARELLGQYVPVCSHGSVLITTRNKAVGVKLAPGKPPIEVDKMDEDESSQLIRAILSDDEISTEESTALASKLEFLPICIAQAAAFILENSMSIEDYIDLLDDSDQTLVDRLSEPFETMGRDSEMPHAVAATWVISFDQIRRQCSLASDFLSFISLFNRQAIPRDFVLDYYDETRGTVGAAQKVDIAKALGMLKAFSFISEARDKSMSIHRLVQLVTRKWLHNEDRLNDFASQALYILFLHYPFTDDDTIRTCENYLPHVHSVLQYGDRSSDKDQRFRARILHHVAIFYVYTEQYELSESIQTECLQISDRVLGKDHEDTLSYRITLSTIQSRLDREDEAERTELEVLETLIKKHGHDHPDTLVCQSALASKYNNQGRYEESETLLIEVIERSKNVQGEDHPDTLEYMDDLANVYCKGVVNRPEDAVVLLQYVIKHRKEKLGSIDARTLNSMSTLAKVYAKLERYEDAVLLAVQTYEESKSKYGIDHDATITRGVSVAALHTLLGRPDLAEPLLAEAYRCLLEKYGTRHWHTERAHYKLALVYSDTGRYDEASTMLTKQLEWYKATKGMDDRLTLLVMGDLANVWARRGRFTEAFVLGNDCLERCTRTLGADHLQAEDIISNLEKWQEWQETGTGYSWDTVMNEEYSSLCEYIAPNTLWLATLKHQVWGRL